MDCGCWRREVSATLSCCTILSRRLRGAALRQLCERVPLRQRQLCKRGEANTPLLINSVHEKLQARRSPLLPAPTAIEDGSSEALAATSSSTTFTVRDLKSITRDWQHRSIALSAKVRGLEVCRREGWPICWAGRVTELGDIRRARDEALWVVEKLERAVQWTKEQQVKKRAYLALPR